MFVRNFGHGLALENDQRFQFGTVSCACQDNSEAILFHSRPQSRVPFGQRHGTKALAGTNLESANRGLPVVLRRLGADPKWLTPVTFGPFGLEILGLTNRRLKGKQYKVLKCVVLDNNDVLAVLETVKSLIYQLLPPVFALISWHLEETHRDEVYCVHCCSYFTAQCARS